MEKGARVRLKYSTQGLKAGRQGTFHSRFDANTVAVIVDGIGEIFYFRPSEVEQLSLLEQLAAESANLPGEPDPSLPGVDGSTDGT